MTELKILSKTEILIDPSRIFKILKFQRTDQSAMSTSSWNEPVPLMSQEMCQRMVRTTDDYLTQIQWKTNCAPTTLYDAVQEAKKGNDGGLELTLSLRPTNRIFEDWINYNNLITYLFNRDTNIRTLLSAIRNTIQKTRQTIYYIS